VKFIENTTWDEIFEKWRESEENNPEWVYCATKIKGWPNWELWRRHVSLQLKAPERIWKKYEFTDPMNEIPKILIGPFSGWQSRTLEKNLSSSFYDLANMPKQEKFFRRKKKIISIMNKFPAPTELIGLIREDNGRIVCIEGHHRAMVVALSEKERKNVDFKGKIYISLAKLSKKEIPILYKTLKEKSVKK